MKKFTIILLILLTASTAYSKYNRKNWKHWKDLDRDCQNTRAEILIRDNVGELVFRKGKRKCSVLRGEWICPYTGKTFYKASDLDIDHIVPLKEAYRSGAKNWTKKQKAAFANDPENLLAVEKSANREKGDKAPHRWVPPLKSYKYNYFEKWIYIKNKYHLSFTKKERDFLGFYNDNQIFKNYFNLNGMGTFKEGRFLRLYFKSKDVFIFSGKSYETSKGAEVDIIGPDQVKIRDFKNNFKWKKILVFKYDGSAFKMIRHEMIVPKLKRK